MFYRAVSTMVMMNPTMDESVHLSAGYSYVSQKDFRLNPEHPSLIKILAGVPLLFLHLDFPKDDPSWITASQWDFGRMFVFQNTKSADTIFFWGRLPMVFIMIALGWFVYFWSKKLFGIRGGLFSLFLYTFDPNIIAHGRLVTTDVGLAFTYLMTIYFFVKYLKDKTIKNLFFSGITFSLAMLAKFSAIFLGPTLVVLAFIYIWIHKQKVLRAHFQSIGSSLISIMKSWLDIFWTAMRTFFKPVIAFIFIFCSLAFIAYGFQLQKPSGDPEFHDNINTSVDIDSGIGQKIYTFASNYPIPAYSFIKGIVMVTTHNKYGHDSFLMGEYRRLGWWYYFPLAFLIKTPVAVFILFGLCVSFFLYRKIDTLKAEKDIFKEPAPRWFRWASNIKRFFITIPIHFYALSIPPFLFLLISLNSKINLGLRHIIIVYPFLYVFLGSLMTFRPKKQYLYQFILAISSIYFIISTSLIYPYYLSYFNEIIGGPSNGHTYLLDSNIDWGQDLKYLKLWMDENDVSTIYLRFFGTALPEYYGIDYTQLPKTNELVNGNTMLGKFGVISISDLFNKENDYSWLKEFQPVTRIGYSMWVYDLR